MFKSNWHKHPAWSAIVVAMALVGLFVLNDWLWCLGLAIAISLAALVSKAFTILFDRLWMGLAHYMGKVSGTIMLTIVFYLLLTPLAFLSRLFGNSDRLKLTTSNSTTFLEVNKTYPPESFEQTW